ncbi:MAG: acyl-CoA thioesterase [Gammaproteobacteria bacterium]|nr:acyl-CoA thioesterase [Gammaproteobacteria bacterium]
MHAVHQAVAHPWQCDIMGHMTTRFYMAMFDDSSYCYIHKLFGWNGARKDGLGWVDVKHTIEYQSEVHAGDLLEVRAKLQKIGGKSLTVSYEMVRLADGEIAATLEGVMVLFDLQKRVAVAIPDDLRDAAGKHI